MEKDLRHTNNGTIILLTILLVSMTFLFIYKLCIAKEPIEIPVLSFDKFRDSTTTINNRNTLVGTSTYRILKIEKPTAKEALLYDTDEFCAANILFAMALVFCILLIEIKLYKRGIFNVDITNYIRLAGYLIFAFGLLLTLRQYVVGNYVFDVTEDYKSAKKGEHSIYIWQCIFVLFLWLANYYKKAFELNKQQELTI